MRPAVLPSDVAAAYQVVLRPREARADARWRPGEVTRWTVGIAVPLSLAFACVAAAIGFGVAWPIFLAILFGPIATAFAIIRLALTSEQLASTGGR